MGLNKASTGMQIYKVAPVGSIDSQKLNSFNEGTANSIASLTSVTNKIIDIINTAPDLSGQSVSIVANGLDGSNIYMDASATSGNLYFDDTLSNGTGTGRPVTIEEAFGQLLDISSRSSQHAREGEYIGDISNPITLSNGASTVVNWPYEDGLFQGMFFKGGTTVTPVDMSLSLNTTSNSLTINNGTGSSVNVWGVVWHPVFAF